MPDGMNFGEALQAMWDEKKVCRSKWNGKGMWLIYVPGTGSVQLKEDSPYYKAGLKIVDIEAHIDMYTTEGAMQPGWLASQADMLANDWEIVE